MDYGANGATNSITLQKNVTFDIVDGSSGNNTSHFSYPTLPNVKSTFRLHGCFWAFKYFYEQSHQSGSRIESDACQIYLYLTKSSENSDVEFHLLCDSGSKANLGGWTLTQMKWISVTIALINPETKQTTVNKRVEGETRCGKLLCSCRQTKLCFRKQAFCPPEYLQPFFVINKCSKPRYGTGATYYCSLDAFVTVTLFPQSPKSTSSSGLGTGIHDLYWKSQHEASKRIFHAKIGTDFRLEVNEKEFPCHKCILAGHSEVFSRMFANENKRKPSTKLVVESMSVVGVESFLKFLYYGDTSFSELSANVAFELMKAGEKYCIPHLRRTSYEILNAKASDDLDCCTALKIFRYVANKLQYSSLKGMALQCFSKKYVELVRSEEFVKLFGEDREMAQEILIKIHKSSSK